MPGVRHATKVRGIDYPVVVDNDYAVWNAFDNHYWPALYFVDADGLIRDSDFGEGRYEESERVIQELLGVERDLVPVEGQGVEAEADWDHLRMRETYLGYGRSGHFVSRDGAALNERRVYEFPERLLFSQWALDGEWTVGPESVVLNRAGGSIACRYDARDAHLVLAPGAHDPIPFRVSVDGDAPGPSHGVDVDEDGSGLLREGRMYQLLREHDTVRERILEITQTERASATLARWKFPRAPRSLPGSCRHSPRLGEERTRASATSCSGSGMPSIRSSRSARAKWRLSTQPAMRLSGTAPGAFSAVDPFWGSRSS